MEILTTPWRMGRKDMERLVGKLRLLNLAVLGAVSHIYHIQCVLAHAGADKASLYPEIHRKVADWRTLAEQIASQITHLADIVRQKPTYLELCEASGLRPGGV